MKNEKKKVIEWIKKYFEENGKNCKAVVGISGGTDSSVVTALCVAALGRENVIGVLMPKGVQHDIDYSKKLVEFLKIKHYEVNVEKPVNDLKKLISQQMGVNPDEFDTISLLEYGWLCFMGFLPLLAGEWLILVICQKILWGIRQNLEMLRGIFLQFLILQKPKCANLVLNLDFLKCF